MNQYKEINFVFENSDYKIVVSEEENGFKIRPLKNNRLLPWTYSVNFDVAFDFHKSVREDAVNHLMQLAKADILEKKFEPFLTAGR
jgi:hypothetical protein